MADLAVRNSSTLLLIKGKALIAIGEGPGGSECIQDALNAGGEKLAKSLFCDGVDTANYVTTAGLSADIAKREQTIQEILADRDAISADNQAILKEKEELSAAGKRASIKSELLSDIISGICKAEEDWESIRQNPKYRDCQHLVDDVFSNDIHTLCMKLRQRDRTLYSAILEKFKERFQVLNATQPLIIEFIASAEFVMRCHRLEDKGRVPIFAGPVVELGKAIELCLKRYLLEPFQKHLLAKWEQGQQNLAMLKPIIADPQLGYDKPIPMFQKDDNGNLKNDNKGYPLKSRPKPWEIEGLLSCADSRWLNYCEGLYPVKKVTWIRDTLPGISKAVRDLRNPAAHFRAIEQTQAATVIKLLEDNNVFEEFEEFEGLAQIRLSKDARRPAHNDRGHQARGGSSLSSSMPAGKSCSNVKSMVADFSKERRDRIDQGLIKPRPQ